MSQPLMPSSARAVPHSEPRTTMAVIKDYIAITKPKHQAVLLTCWATMTLAGGLPFGQFLFVLFTTGLAVASSHAFNQLIDSDLDAKMTRTRDRPLAAKRISRTGAAVFGILLFVASIALAVWRINVLTAWLIFAGFFIYVVIYSWWLKRRTPWCTLVGGASGAMPTLIGWAAVTGRIDVTPFLLFLFMLIWQSPHFYALSLFRWEDYHKAGWPVVVVAHGITGTLRRIIANTVAMIVPTILLYPAGAAGLGYLITVSLTGGLYLAGVIAANIQGEAHAPKWGKRLFFGSYLYMATIFISVVIDRI